MRTKIMLVLAVSCFLAGQMRASTPEKPKVFVSGTVPGGGSTAADTTRILVKACPELVITLDPADADYTVIRDIGGGIKTQKLTVFDSRRQLIYTGQTFTVRGAATDACKAIRSKAEPADSHK